jgi:hypothetical protein
MQKYMGFFFAWWFVVLDAKATSVWAPASAGVTSSGAILANVHTRARSSVIVRLVIWAPRGVVRKTPCRNAWVFFRLMVCGVGWLKPPQYGPRHPPG